jgi:hypothetical protein
MEVTARRLDENATRLWESFRENVEAVRAEVTGVRGEIATERARVEELLRKEAERVNAELASLKAGLEQRLAQSSGLELRCDGLDQALSHLSARMDALSKLELFDEGLSALRDRFEELLKELDAWRFTISREVHGALLGASLPGDANAVRGDAAVAPVAPKPKPPIHVIEVASGTEIGIVLRQALKTSDNLVVKVTGEIRWERQIALRPHQQLAIEGPGAKAAVLKLSGDTRSSMVTDPCRVVLDGATAFTLKNLRVEARLFVDGAEPELSALFVARGVAAIEPTDVAFEEVVWRVDLPILNAGGNSLARVRFDGGHISRRGTVVLHPVTCESVAARQGRALVEARNVPLNDGVEWLETSGPMTLALI